MHYGSELKAEAGGWKIIMFFLFLFFFKCFTGFTVIEFTFVTNKPKTLMGCFSLLCQKKDYFDFFSFGFYDDVKCCNLTCFSKIIHFGGKKMESNNFHACEIKKKNLLFFAVTEAQVPKFSEHMGQDAS